MAWVQSVERKDGEGRIQPSQVTAFVKVFEAADSTPIVQIDTLGSQDRKNPGKQSQTLQFGREPAKELFDILRHTYNF
jgi:hypothetical protein